VTPEKLYDQVKLEQYASKRVELIQQSTIPVFSVDEVKKLLTLITYASDQKSIITSIYEKISDKVCLFCSFFFLDSFLAHRVEK
jgi:hypothetical protein